MGILNVTPDSFFDGGRYTDLQAIGEPLFKDTMIAARQALRLVRGEKSAARTALVNWVEAKKASVIEAYDLKLMQKKVDLMKANFLEQKKYWQMPTVHSTRPKKVEETA